MNKFKNQYIAFYSNGEKMHFSALSSNDATEIAQKNAPHCATVEFITNAKGDYPFDYDWDSTTKCWQANIF